MTFAIFMSDKATYTLSEIIDWQKESIDYEQRRDVTRRRCPNGYYFFE